MFKNSFLNPTELFVFLVEFALQKYALSCLKLNSYLKIGNEKLSLNFYLKKMIELNAKKVPNIIIL